MKKLIILWAVVAVVTVTISAGNNAVRNAIEAGEKQFSAAFAKGDAAAVSELYSLDAEVLAPNGTPIPGRAAIKAFWQAAWDAGVRRVETSTSEVEGGGGLYFEKGSYSLKGADASVLDDGKYIVIWKKQGKDWKMYRDIWNTNRKN